MSEKAKESAEEFTGFKCPACKEGTIIIKKNVYDLPDDDKMIILNFKCNKCVFNKNDVIPLTTRMEPGIISLKVTNEEDLRSKIYRSPTGKLEIPELELEVEPGPRADFYYTNVEGVLLRFESAVLIYMRDFDDDDPEKEEIEEIFKNLQKAVKGQFEFTLKITDHGGGSYIIPKDDSKYTFKKIDNVEVEKE